MSAGVAIRVKSVSKKFSRRLRNAMLYGVADALREGIGSPPDRSHLRPHEFWALKDVDFGVSPGDCLGIIGANGSGKSTLLKLISGILRPDRGRIETRGRIGALIEVGAGFHPLLTGRENIYMNGSILGMTRTEIDRNFDAIVDFAEIGESIDTPVKFYSSGMYVRLGFAIAARLAPDILLIDEVLAVGDARFRAKCYDVIYRFIREKAVVMVSHDMMHIARACSRLLVLGNGKATLFKDVYQGIDQYLNTQKTAGSTVHEGSAARLSQLTASTPSGEATFKPGGILEIGFTLEFLEPCPRARIIVSVLDRSLTPVAANVIEDDTGSPPLKRRYRLEITSLPLAAGLYKISVSVFQADTPRQLLWHYAVKDLPVDGEASFFHTPVRLVGNWSVDGIRRPVS